jgi:hypothetical protein
VAPTTGTFHFFLGCSCALRKESCNNASVVAESITSEEIEALKKLLKECASLPKDDERLPVLTLEITRNIVQTPNTVGLAGLGAGVAWILARGIGAIRAHEEALRGRADMEKILPL